jgi:hypothetical protein
LEHTFDEKNAPLAQKIGHFWEAPRKLTTETTMTVQAGIQTYLTIIKYTYKLEHTFDERKKHH